MIYKDLFWLCSAGLTASTKYQRSLNKMSLISLLQESMWSLETSFKEEVLGAKTDGESRYLATIDDEK